ncbi:MAG: hypothetical protein PVF27_02060, partial [Gemmatimonadales bacterium]
MALPLPASSPYRYEVPPAMADRIVPGARVIVPVRSRALVGVVVDVDEQPDETLKQVLLTPDAQPLLSGPLLELAQWIARYYATPLGMSLRAMLPAALWGRSRLVANVARSTASGGGASRDVLEALAAAGGRAAATTLARKLRRPVWDTLQRLARAGAVTLETEPPDPGPAIRTERIVVLTTFLPTLLERERTFGRAARQRAAYEAVDALGGEAPVAHLSRQ